MYVLRIPMESSMLYINILDYFEFSIGSALGSHIWPWSKWSPYSIFQLINTIHQGLQHPSRPVVSCMGELGQVVKSLKKNSHSPSYDSMANAISLGEKNAFFFHRCHLLTRLQTKQAQSIMPTQKVPYVMGYPGDQSHIYKHMLSFASQILPRNLGIRSNDY